LKTPSLGTVDKLLKLIGKYSCVGIAANANGSHHQTGVLREFLLTALRLSL
jgi:hypothetical protein